MCVHMYYTCKFENICLYKSFVLVVMFALFSVLKYVPSRVHVHVYYKHTYVRMYLDMSHFIGRVVNWVQKKTRTAIRGVIVKGKTLCHYSQLKYQPRCV